MYQPPTHSICESHPFQKSDESIYSLISIAFLGGACWNKCMSISPSRPRLCSRSPTQPFPPTFLFNSFFQDSRQDLESFFKSFFSILLTSFRCFLYNSKWAKKCKTISSPSPPCPTHRASWLPEKSTCTALNSPLPWPSLSVHSCSCSWLSWVPRSPLTLRP